MDVEGFFKAVGMLFDLIDRDPAKDLGGEMVEHHDVAGGEAGADRRGEEGLACNGIYIGLQLF